MMVKRPRSTLLCAHRSKPCGGTTQRVIIDREEEEYYVGRTQYDSPEVDPEVLITKITPLITGNFYNAHITSALPFELMATI